MSKKRNEFIINDVITTLNDGGIVVLPTDTVYGMAIKYGNEKAKKRLYEIKGRDYNKELPFVVSSFQMLETIAFFDMNLVSKLSEFYPGALTIILKKKEGIISTKDTIAVRMINNEFINTVIEKIKSPLLLTSANKSNEEPICDPYLLFDVFEDEVDIIVMGPHLKNEPSTIIDLSSGEIKLVREGKIPFTKILEALK